MKPVSQSDLDILKKLDLKAPYVWIATWFGAGLFRPAPGTWGSALSIPPALILFSYSGIEFIIAGIVLITLTGLWAADRFDAATGGHDNKMIVIDEAAGQWIALLPAFYFTGLDPLFILLAFVAFRAFDILKPWPVSFFDKKVKGAVGVMGDDLIAGGLAALCLWGIHYAF